jgi:H+/Cl- antiporter ClcA
MLVFNAFVNPIALEAVGWKYYLLWVVVLAIILAVVYLFFPETKGRPLEEIPEIFEGPAIVPKYARRLLQRRST